MKKTKSLKAFSENLDLNILKEAELIKVKGGGRKIPLMTIIVAENIG